MFFRFRFVLWAIVLPCVFVSCHKDNEEPFDVLVDFQNVDIPNDPGYINNAGNDLDGVFKEGIISFPNYFNEDSWSGFAYSQKHDLTTEGFVNQYSVYVANEPENKFMVVSAFDPYDYSPTVSLTFEKPLKDLSFDLANATYAALSMIKGDGFAKQFTDSDWFELTIVATNSKNVKLPPQLFKLAEGIKIVDKWIRINIAGEGIVELQFSLSSSDTGDWGINTPTYFCIDNIKARTVK